MKNKTIVAAIALISVFLGGFVPQYVKTNRLENELSANLAKRPQEPNFGI